MSVDPKVHDLAASFLLEIEGATDDDVRDLAESIQMYAELFASNLRAEFQKSKRAVNELPGA